MIYCTVLVEGPDRTCHINNLEHIVEPRIMEHLGGGGGLLLDLKFCSELVSEPCNY